MSTIDLAAFYPRAAHSRSNTKVPDFSMRGRVIVGSVAAILLLGGLGGWSATAKLSSAVISGGTVLVVESVKVIQHLDGGVIRAINVKEGQFVTAGDVLLRLDDVQIRTEQSILGWQLAELLARQARLVAERDGAQQITFPDDFLMRFPEAGLILQGEQQLFDSTRRNRNSQREQLLLQVAQLEQEIGGLHSQADALADELALATEERGRLDSLSAQALIEQTRINAADRELARMLGSQGALTASIARSNARISEVRLQILAIDDLASTESQRELRSVSANVAEVSDRLAEVTERLGRTLIRAPVSGTVNELAVSTLGGVVSPAERLLTIVPEDADLRIEFKIAVNDIDQILLGQEARLRFSAFDQRTTPEIPALVSRISAAALTDQQSGSSYYIAEAEVIGDIDQLGERGLIPGMPVEVFVTTQEQPAIAYFVKPFTDQVARAFREE
ncbi:HlyD family type I secretion periplasmic adaptor subunit [Devosia sp. XJ19-1]|uniref:Membrane fusion protein (MFP) family protein n=1 Tax=Devosia ureilytica TaxID=2952754 RepID=A0A9Q4AN97_9HYPH|nr:HlyD family type I secretion periplasmic adaptor subunit [Devosia ureilytica]MCP8883730.1 HlyD family type I secretion periplasmic adaptor subunit [Devosia ureilytica]MCP8887338.1 HlyD family type I secretion periplasmic adaptor subunit [Devosia ureilytica]